MAFGPPGGYAAGIIWRLEADSGALHGVHVGGNASAIAAVGGDSALLLPHARDSRSLGATRVEHSLVAQHVTVGAARAAVHHGDAAHREIKRCALFA